MNRHLKFTKYWAFPFLVGCAVGGVVEPWWVSALVMAAAGVVMHMLIDLLDIGVERFRKKRLDSKRPPLTK